MKISKTFIKIYLVLFLLVILANIILPFVGLWNVSYLAALSCFVLFIFFLVYRKKDNGTVKFFKFLILLIPLIILGFIFYQNFVASQDFHYNYDVGGSIDAKKPYLTPLVRMSNIDNITSSRNITSALVYFDVPIPARSNTINISITVLNTLPYNYTLKIGAKNGSEWNYSNQIVFQNTNKSLRGKWVTVNATFNMSNLYLKNNKLNVLITLPHFYNENFKNYTIPIDYINITVHKDGLF